MSVQRTSPRRGFTLIEIIIVMAMISVLLALAVPAFTGYIKRSRASEAGANLNLLFKGASMYYQQGYTGAQGVASNQAGYCIVATSAMLPALPSSQKQQTDFQTVTEFRALGFSVADPIYYGYRIIAGGASTCANAASDTTVYTFQAMGDIDGDGVFSTFALAVGTDTNNELYHARALYFVNELE